MSRNKLKWYRIFWKLTNGHEFRVSLGVSILFFVATIFIPNWIPQVFNISINEGGKVKIEYVALFAKIFTALLFAGLSGFLTWFITKFPNDMLEIREEVAKVFYKGFHTLLNPDIKKSFEDFENIISTGTASSEMRGIIFDFVLNSLANIGKSGFVMVDASVDNYVKYIAETVKKADDIRMTCVVRPYWFVVDEIEKVSSPPYKRAKGEYGKGEHLRFFKQGAGQYNRTLIVDEPMLAEMFLTASISKHFLGLSNNDCPVCKACPPKTCPFHNGDKLMNKSLNEFPEIWWFLNDVNQRRGISLSYTLVRRERRKAHKELDDRIYVSSPSPPLDIRFNFTNLETGILRITWGDKAQKLARISIPSDKTFVFLNPETETSDGTPHKFYPSFRHVLKDELKNEINDHLKILKDQLKKQNETISTGIKCRFEESVRKIPDEHLSKLLANGHSNFVVTIMSVVDSLMSDINKKSLDALYQELVNFHKKNGIPKVAYVVTNDMLHFEYPVRVARWKFNWDGDGACKEGILNAPD